MITVPDIHSRVPRTRACETFGPALLLVGVLLIACSAEEIWGIDDPYIDLMLFGRGIIYRHAQFVLDDPLIKVVLVPIVGELEDRQSMARAMRVYYPRTYESLVRNDVVIFEEAPLGWGGFTNFYPDILGWFKKMVIEGGKAVCMFGGDASFGSEVESPYPSWEDTPVAQILPVDIIPGGNRAAPSWPSPWRLVPIQIRFIDDVMGLSRLPWDTAPVPNLLLPLNAVNFRLGATRVAVGAYKDDEWPLIAFWKIGDGRSVAYTAVYGSGGTRDLHDKWKWHYDFVSYMIYAAAGVPPPEDINVPHVFREKMRTFRSLRDLAYRSLDFVDRMGGNTAKLERRIAEISLKKDDLSLAYLGGDYEVVIEGSDGILREMTEILEDIGALGRRTMFWIYLTEWCVVSGTMVLCGWVLHFLMIRRGLYREVETTRLV